MKYYIAGPCCNAHRSFMHSIKNHIMTLIHPEDEVYFPFEFKVENAWDYSQEIWSQKVFDNDIKHIRESDVVIIISFGRHSTAGTNFEQGYAFALGKKVYVIQIDENADTSLMTYCGSTLFFNSSMKNIYEPLTCIFTDIIKNSNSWIKNKCETILT